MKFDYRVGRGEEEGNGTLNAGIDYSGGKYSGQIVIGWRLLSKKTACKQLPAKFRTILKLSGLVKYMKAPTLAAF